MSHVYMLIFHKIISNQNIQLWYTVPTDTSKKQLISLSLREHCGRGYGNIVSGCVLGRLF